MFRNPEEIEIARLRYVEGLKQGEIAIATGLNQSTVSRALAIFKVGFRQLGLDPNHPEEIREAVQVILKRAHAAQAA